MNTKKGVIPIFFATDDNYAPFLLVAIESIATQASKEYDYHIHVLCSQGLNEKNRGDICDYGKDNVKIFIDDISPKVAERESKMHSRYYYSNAIYFRAFIPNLFPQYDKVIYLDCDIAVNADISELYNFELGDNYIGAVTCETVDTTPVFTAYAEKFLGFKLPKYFNTGVMVLNCAVLRKINFEDRFFDILEKLKLEICPDQDYFNILCKNNVVFLPKVWNKIPRKGSSEKLEDVKLAHYNLSLKPWRYDGILYEELFWKHARNTVAYDWILAIKGNISAADVESDKQRMAAISRMAEEFAKETETIEQKIKSGKIVLLK